ncbi:MAG: dTMP kinase [Candidatus Aenigmatarchaeota archaeon]
MKGKFIIFEGIDSSGKKTQTNLLAEKLRSNGEKVEVLHFPTYQKTPLGVFVAKYLKGDFGSKEEMTPEICSLFYSMDRYQFQNEIKDKLDAGVNIISDRFTASNIFQAAKLEGARRFEIWEWIKDIDKRMPQPDAIIILDVPPKVSRKLFSKREKKNEMIGGEKDIHEEDMSYQEIVRRTYLDIADIEGWIVIECCKNGNFISPEEIHKEVYARLQERDII